MKKFGHKTFRFILLIIVVTSKALIFEKLYNWVLLPITNINLNPFQIISIIIIFKSAFFVIDKNILDESMDRKKESELVKTKKAVFKSVGYVFIYLLTALCVYILTLFA